MNANGLASCGYTPALCTLSGAFVRLNEGVGKERWKQGPDNEGDDGSCC